MIDEFDGSPKPDPADEFEKACRRHIPRKKGTWKMRDGKVIQIKKMTDSHLRNTLNMLKRKGFIAQSTLFSYLGPGPNGDAAQELFDREFQRVLDAPVCPAMDDLEAEAAKRKIWP